MERKVGEKRGAIEKCLMISISPEVGLADLWLDSLRFPE
jgi:hypothetical protein